MPESSCSRYKSSAVWTHKSRPKSGGCRCRDTAPLVLVLESLPHGKENEGNAFAGGG